MLALAAAALSFTGPASLVSPSAVVARTDVQMNTKYTVAAGMAKKKGATGQSKSLWGYTVGSRAPDTAVSSGTTKSAQGLWEKLFSKPTEYKQTAGTSACRNDHGPPESDPCAFMARDMAARAACRRLVGASHISFPARPRRGSCVSASPLRMPRHEHS